LIFEFSKNNQFFLLFYRNPSFHIQFKGNIMAGKYSNIDDYINAAQPFAQPILKHLRALVHKACPDVEEKIKWSFPHFEYKGPICHMAAFKQHCAFGFWKAPLMADKTLIDKAATEEAMGHFGRITSLKDLPSDRKLIAYIKEAMALNEEGIKVTPPKKILGQTPDTPEDFKKMLKLNTVAWEVFQAFPPSHKKEYIHWILEAKSTATRERRIQTAVLQIAEKKAKNWKYEKK
jgi:uncharacterized protein YdeI (YjbR/CyaY-like superfamily)